MFCPNCGKALADDAKFCDACGASVDGTAKAAGAGAQTTGNAEEKIKAFAKVEDRTAEFDADDIAKNKGLSLLSYLGILLLIPLFAAKDSKFARFHINQGLTLFLAGSAVDLVWGILSKIIGIVRYSLPGMVFYEIGTALHWIVTILFVIVGLALLALAVTGIVNACSGKAKTLPVLGNLHLFD